MSLSERLSNLDPEDPEYPDVLERRALEEEERKNASALLQQSSIDDVELRSYALQAVVSLFTGRSASVKDILASTHTVFEYLKGGEPPDPVSVDDPGDLYTPGSPPPGSPDEPEPDPGDFLP